MLGLVVRRPLAVPLGVTLSAEWCRGEVVLLGALRPPRLDVVGVHRLSTAAQARPGPNVV